MLNQLEDLSAEEAKKLCLGLRQIPISTQSGLVDITEYWIQGDERYFDIFIHTKNDSVVWFQVTFRGLYLEWANQIFKSGTTHEFEVKEPNKAPSNRFLTGERDVNNMLIRQVSKIISQSSIPLLLKMNSILQKTLN